MLMLFLCHHFGIGQKGKLRTFFSTDIKPNYRTSIWAKGSRRRSDVFASATDDPYTVNDLQLKRERKGGDCTLIRFQNHGSSPLKSPSRFDKS